MPWGYSCNHVLVINVSYFSSIEPIDLTTIHLIMLEMVGSKVYQDEFVAFNLENYTLLLIDKMHTNSA